MILCHQAPLYDYVSQEECINTINTYGPERVSVTQNLEDLIVSVEMEDKLDLYPLLKKENWDKQEDISESPAISLRNTAEETRSGVFNGIKIILDLGKRNYSNLNQKYITNTFSETFDNADPTITFDALRLIVNNKDSFPSFDLEGLSIK